jgi:glycerophosphoryl diester phosphodiesterase
MSKLLFIALELSRRGAFTISSGIYDGMTVSSSPEATLLIYGVVNSAHPLLVTIPVFPTEKSHERIGILHIPFSALDLDTRDSFEFVIDEDRCIELRIARTSPMSGPIQTETPIPIPEPIVVGHRGFGANSFSWQHLENSLPGCEAAHAAGAQAVEIDVQLSSDDIPVVIHDFEVLTRKSRCQETRAVQQLTAAQFKESGLCTQYGTKRSSLGRLLTSLPKDLIFDIEFKFRLNEESAGYTDRNHYVDRILEVMEKHGNGRKMFCCTFDLIVAAMIAFKQSKYQVMLLAGVQETDPVEPLVERVRSLTPLMELVGIDGFVFHSPNLVIRPSLVEECKKHNFVVMSWGGQNLMADGVATQLNAGVTGFVTDDIGSTKRSVERARKD